MIDSYQFRPGVQVNKDNCAPASSLFLTAMQGMWDLSSLTRYETHSPTVEAQSLNPWTIKEVQAQPLLDPLQDHAQSE